MWSHKIIICKRNKPNLVYLTDIFWWFKTKFPSPVVLVCNKTLGKGKQRRQSFIILSFPTTFLLENGITN